MLNAAATTVNCQARRFPERSWSARIRNTSPMSTVAIRPPARSSNGRTVLRTGSTWCWNHGTSAETESTPASVTRIVIKRVGNRDAVGGGAGAAASAATVASNSGGSSVPVGPTAPSVPTRPPMPGSGRNVGNRITSRIDGVPVSSITRRSMPSPSPPVGGIPYSRART